MKKILLTLLFCIVCVTPGWAAMTLGAAVVSGSNFNATLSLTYAGTTTGRGMVCLFIFDGNGSALTTVTVGSDTAIKLGTPAYNTGNNSSAQITYVGSMTGSGSQTISATWSNTGSIYGACQELYDSVSTGILLDGTAVNGQGTAANPSISITTATNSSAVLSIIETADVGGDIGAGYTVIKREAILNREVSEYNLNVGTAGTYSVPFTSSSANYSIAAAAFKASGGGGGPTYRSLGETGDGR